MRQLLYYRSNTVQWYRRFRRSYSLIGLLLISAVALMACGPTATPGPTVPPDQTPVIQPTPTPGDQPTPTLQLVEEPAPVESVAIEVTSTDPVSAELVLVTGLPSGCVSFKGYNLERAGDIFQVTATNVRPDQEDLVCTMIYGMETTRIPLTGDIEVCETYTVVVNDQSFSVQTQVPGQECDSAPMLEEPAPVESVAIEVTSTDPVSAELVLVTGLPSGCVSFKGYTMERQGDTFQVTATNVRPDQEGLVCTMIYGMETTRIPLDGEIEVCKAYTVVVNEQFFLAQAQVPGQECTGGQWSPVLEEPAPIESVAIEAEATDPVQASLVVVSGLPNACYAFGRYDISRDGDTFQVQVKNVKPDDPNQACAELYRVVTTRVPLPGEVEICRTYTVNINGESYSVQAIAPNVRCADTSGNTGTEAALSMGETVTVGDEGLQLTLLEVTEDSRCPSDALCIQAGQATANVRVEMDGRELGTVSLTLGEGVGSVPETLEGYTFALTRLDPHPVSTMEIQPGDYVAYVLVSRS